MKVIHVVLSLDVGGLERLVVDLARSGQGLRQSVWVVCLESFGTLAPQVEAVDAKIICIHKAPGLRWGTVRDLKAILRQGRPDVVHTHQIGALFYAGPAARDVGIPVVVHTEHGKHYGDGFRRRWLGRVAGHFAARFICVSKDIAADVVRHQIVPRRKVFVVPNGIDTSRFGGAGDPEAVRRSLRIPPGAPVIGFLGRLDEIKQPDVLLRTFSRVQAEVRDVHLLMVGDGPLMSDLKVLATGLGVASSVRFVGYQARPEHYLQGMDVLVLTSRSEGMPVAVLEAWAAGLPVVAPRVGGLPEMIEDGRTGRLFPPADEAALASLLSELLGDRKHSRLMGAAGRLRVEARFSLERMAEDYQRHYLDVLGRRRKVR